MPIKDRLDDLSDEQKIYLCMILYNLRGMDDFAKSYPNRDEYFNPKEPYYAIGTDFCAYSYTEKEVLELIFNTEQIAEKDYIEFVIDIVEEAI